MIKNAENLRPNGQMSSFQFGKLESNPSLSPGLYAAHRKPTPKLFRYFSNYIRYQ